MRIVSLTLLGLFFLSGVYAVSASQVSDQKVVQSQPKKEEKKPKALCNPKEATKMPETFY